MRWSLNPIWSWLVTPATFSLPLQYCIFHTGHHIDQRACRWVDAYFSPLVTVRAPCSVYAEYPAASWTLVCGPIYSEHDALVLISLIIFLSLWQGARNKQLLSILAHSFAQQSMVSCLHWLKACGQADMTVWLWGKKASCFSSFKRSSGPPDFRLALPEIITETVFI